MTRVRAAILPAAFMLVLPMTAFAVDDAAVSSHRAGIWEIAPQGTMTRWIVIHNLEDAGQTGVFHIEVIGREKGRPAWDVRRICSHMAVTAEALKRSILKPLKSGAVYPEPFDDAYAAWKKRAEGGHADICDTSVLECLPDK